MAQRAPNVITGLVVTNLPLIHSQAPKKTLMKVQVGQQTVKTTASQSSKWDTNIVVSSDITAIRFLLYTRGVFGFKKLLATVEVSVDKLVPTVKELSVTFVVERSNQTSTLVVHYESNIQQVASNLVDSSPKPTEGVDLSTVLESIRPFKGMFDRLAEVHPLANAAWSLLTVGIDVLDAQHAKDKGIVDLYKAMLHTFEIANEKDVVRNWKILEPTFEVMIKQTIECQIFISGYIKKSYVGKCRLIKLDISQKTAEFRQGFIDIEAEFTGKLNRGIAVTAIGTHEAVKDIAQNQVLSRLQPHAPLMPRDPCLLGTRLEPMASIISWIADMNGQVMFLTGLPGTGKSTLMSSIADAARDMGPRSRLGAYIRFDTKLLNSPSNIVATIAYKLAFFDKRIADAVSTAVDRTPDFGERSIQQQFKILLLDPLRSVKELEEEGPIVVLVDGLDECEASPARLQLCKVLSDGFGPTLPFMRLIVSGRAIQDITAAFDPKKAHIHIYSLNNITEATERDIRLYFTQRFAQLGDDDFRKLCTEKVIEDLAKRACGLFIWASITYKFIEQLPSERLLKILGTDGPTEPEAALDSIYRIALNAALSVPGSNDDIKGHMRTILGAIILVVDPPGLNSISTNNGLLFLGSSSKFEDIYPKLACVVRIDRSRPNHTLRFIHKSFYDFLVDKRRSGDDWYIDLPRHKASFAGHCVRALVTHFENHESNSVAAFTSSTILDEVLLEGGHVYACALWVHHLCQLDPKDQELDSLIRVFLQKHFLKWIQVMAKLGMADFILVYMSQFLNHTNRGLCSEEDRALRYDAFQCASQFIADIKSDPIIAFTAGLAFCPHTSRLQSLYSLPQDIPKVEGTGCNRLLTLIAPDSEIPEAVFDSAVLFSGGSKIASASNDGTVRIWDAHTGAPLSEPLQGHTEEVSCIAVSPDGSKFASGGKDNAIVIWDAVSGRQLMEPLRGHEKPVCAVDFSPDSSTIMSVGSDESIRTWDAATGRPILGPIRPRGDESLVTAVFSPDGTKILSAGGDSICIWDASNSNLPLLHTIPSAGQTLSLAFSPDGKRFVSGSSDTHVHIWNSATGESAMKPLRGHNNLVFCVSFSKDGTKIASASVDGTIRIWDAATGDILAEPIQNPTDILIRSVCWSPDDKRLLSECSTGLCIWEVSDVTVPIIGMHSSSDIFQLCLAATGRTLLSSKSHHMITAVAFSPDGTKFVSVDLAGAIRVWDAATSSLDLAWNLDHTAYVSTAVFSPLGDMIAVCVNHHIQLWDVRTGDHIHQFHEGHDDDITALSFSSDGTTIVSASADKTIRLWDIATRKQHPQSPIHGHTDDVCTAVFSPDNKTIASGSGDHTVRLWHTSSGQQIHDPLRGHVSPVSHIAWSPNGEFIASASDDFAMVNLWDISKREVVRALKLPLLQKMLAMPRFIQFTRAGDSVVVASSESMICGWDVRRDSEDPTFVSIHHDHSDVLGMAAAISPDHSMILWGSLDGTLCVWEASSGKTLWRPIEKKAASVTSFCHNGELVALGVGSDSTIHVWNTVTRCMAYEPLVGHKSAVLSLSMDPNNTRLVSGSEDMSFIVWDLPSGELLYRVEAHTGIINSVVFSPDGSKIVTAGADSTIRLWEASGGASLLEGPLTGHTDSVVSVAFSPDGLHLVSASLDGTIRVWESSTGAPAFVTESIDETLQGVVFSSDGQSLIYAVAGDVLHKWPCAAFLATSTSSSDNATTASVPLTQSEVLIRFPKRLKIATAYMNSKQFLAMIQDTYQLIRVSLP